MNLHSALPIKISANIMLCQLSAVRNVQASVKSMEPRWLPDHKYIILMETIFSGSRTSNRQSVKEGAENLG
jgi:hypothetical protein